MDELRAGGRADLVVERLVEYLLAEVAEVAEQLSAEPVASVDEIAGKLLSDAETADLCTTPASLAARRAALLRCAAWAVLGLGAMVVEGERGGGCP